MFNLYLERVYYEEVPDKVIKSYAFDWDDNIQYLPTKIKLADSNGNIIDDFSTEEFSYKRNDPKILKMLNNGYKWDFSSFRNNDEFLKDVKQSSPGPSWEDFVECINNAFLFAIITARGHSVETYKQVIKNMINNNENGINKELVLKNIKDFRQAAGHSINLPDDRLINKYINQGRYYPVSNPEVQAKLGSIGGAESPEKLKVKALMDFKGYVKKMSGELIKKIGDREIKIGFSDDDKKNYLTMKEAVKGNNFTLKYTGK